MKLHADYVKTQMQALTEQARDLAQHAAKAATPAQRPAESLTAQTCGPSCGITGAFLCNAIFNIALQYDRAYIGAQQGRKGPAGWRGR